MIKALYTWLIQLKMLRYCAILIVLIAAGLDIKSYSQEWVRTYTSSTGNGYGARWVIESYDKGFVMLGDAFNYKYGIILKTNINGDLIWKKLIGNGIYQNVPENIEQTIDSGYIISGTTSKYGTNDAYLLKLNPCFETEWCKVLYTNKQYPDYARRVKPLPDGGFLLLTAYYEGIAHGTRIHLHKFDSSGELLWQNAYANSDSSIFNEEGFDISIINENEYLITGTCYYPDSGQTGGRVRPYLIKSDSSGYPIWDNPWNIFDTYWGKAYKSTVDNSGNSYSVGYRIGLTGQYPTMIKTNPGGLELLYSDLIDTATFGQGQTVTFMGDSNLFIALGWRGIDQIWHNGFMKADTFGMPLGFSEVTTLSHALNSTAKTSDNKFITVGTHKDNDLNRWVIYAFKVNSDLEFDSIYTAPFIYDSLCPYNIPSDTTDLDCDLLVNIDEFPTKEVYESTIKISPNPARDWALLTFPENFKNDHIDLAVYNTFGQAVIQKEVTITNNMYTLETSGLPSGLYITICRDKKKNPARGKFVVVR